MAYIFCVLNSLQGLFIFVFHCVQNEKVRKEYRKFIRRHSWLPKCLRCSKTVTGSTSGSTGTSGGGGQHGVNGGKDYQSHNTSSNPSAPTTDSSGLSPHAASNNISFKSYSRDSGHGGSEQEDSPRTHNTMTLGHSTRTRERRQLCDGLEISTTTATNNRQNRRAASPYNHTYTEIRDGINVGIGRLSGYHTSHLSRGLINDDDPVYEEIERGGGGGNTAGLIGIGNLNINNGIGEIQVSDMSDEDGRRQSDMSRQSSRSYGDHRPLIPYSPANDRLIQYGQTIERNNCLQQQQQQQQEYNNSQYSPAQERAINAYWDKFRRQTPKHEHIGDINNRIQDNNYGLPQQDHTRTVAVLNGHTVVCHLQPQTDMYTGRGVPPPSYSEC